ncbi:MAG: hypothetical protein OXH56_08975 [Gemmatimonadetes bacterium]|nr:hypothetical protein [Gemmatimonadota bacterium]
MDDKILVALAAVIGSLLGVLLGKLWDRRNEAAALFRELKVQKYESITELFSKAFSSAEQVPPGANPDDVVFLHEWQLMALMRASPETLNAYLKFRKDIQEGGAGSVFAFGEFFLALRKDLGLSNRGINDEIFARLVWANADRLIPIAKKNPHIDLAELDKHHG